MNPAQIHAEQRARAALQRYLEFHPVSAAVRKRLAELVRPIGSDQPIGMLAPFPGVVRLGLESRAR